MGAGGDRAEEAQRLHDALCSAFESLCAVLDGARFERRNGYAWLVCPSIPIPLFNGVWPHDDTVADELENALDEIAAMGLPYSVQTRRGRTPAFEREAMKLGLTAAEPIPGMVARPVELREPDLSGVEIIRVATADGLAEALAVCAEGFGAPAEFFVPLYAPEVAALDGFEVYLARTDGVDISTAVGYSVQGAVGIFNVATPPARRGRGYGALVTAAATREGFRAGAQLAWLQSSAIGHSVYRRLGFRDVETYVLHTLPATPA